ncbi:hypothetical protein [Paenibacillus silvisoli]|uniref:hypothetical protein n=1 Tax=Paenibacillus silvisoli TaxID=3110539 RepID=UPI0028057617|nr:hypothetical protein [Paenibacillus silvisoli]
MSSSDQNAVDFSFLNAYYIRISPDGAANPSFEMPAADFMRAKAVSDAIVAGGSAVRPTGNELAASFIGGSLFGLCAARLLFLARYNAVLDLSLHRLTFQIENFGTYNLFGFKLDDDYDLSAVPDDANRGEFIQSVFENDFKRLIAPIIRSLSETAGMKPDLIWQQYGSMLANLMKSAAAKETNGDALERLKHDCGVLLNRMDGSVFGSRKNPFVHTPRYIDNPYQPGSTMMIRSGCCMYYCREDGDMCYNCPKLAPAKREARRLEILAASGGGGG